MPAVNGTGNRILTPDIITKESLVRLKNKCVLAPLVYKDARKHFAKAGETISIRKPHRTKTASGATFVAQPLVDQSISLTIGNHRHFGIEATMRDMSLSIDQFFSRYVDSGIAQLANDIDRSIALKLKEFYYSSGTPGTALTTKALHVAKAHMGRVGVPDDGKRSAVLDMLDAADISDSVAGKFNAAMVQMALKEGYLGPLAGMNLYESANLYSHTVGNYSGTPLIKGASQTGSTLVTDGWTNSVTDLLLAGDVFTIAGVYEINPLTRESTGRLQHFVVLEDADSNGSGEATLSISPSIITSSSTTTDGTGASVSLAAYQTVSNAPADNAAITVIGTANASYRQDYLFHRDAIAMAFVEFELPESAKVASRVRDPETGFSLTYTKAWDGTNYKEITRIDAMWGVRAVYPEVGHRIWGPALA